MNNKYFVGMIVIAIIAIIGMFLPRGNTVVERVTEKLGIAAGPESTNNYQCYSGVCTYYARSTLKAATTTPCALRSPTHATSTLSRFMLSVTTATGTAATYDIATSTDAFSTTSPQIAMAVSIAANAQHTFTNMGTTTSLSNNQNQYNLMPPGSWVVMKTAGAGSGGYTWGGACVAEFKTVI